MRALIVGATGFVGKNLCEFLVKHEIDYDTINREWNKPQATSYDIVFYLAGEVRKQAEMYDAHVKLLYRVLAMSLAWENCIFIYVGSSSEYGRMDRPMKETDLINPTNLYEATKGMGTLLCQGFAREFDRPVAIIRPSSVYGKYERPEKFIPTVIRKIKNHEPVDVYSGSHDWIHVDDVFEAMAVIVQKGDLTGEIYNVSSEMCWPNRVVVKTINAIMGEDCEVITHDEKFHQHDTDCWVVDNSKLRALGWNREYSFVSGLEKTVREILEIMK